MRKVTPSELGCLRLGLKLRVKVSVRVTVRLVFWGVSRGYISRVIYVQEVVWAITKGTDTRDIDVDVTNSL